METIGLLLAAMITAGVEFEWPNTLIGCVMQMDFGALESVAQ